MALLALEVLHNSCNMGTRDLPEIYAQSPRAQSLLPMLQL